MTEYEKETDEALVEAIVSGNADAMDFLMNKYKNLVRSRARTLFLVGADKEDLIQEGMIGLFKSIRDYDPGRDASFFTFADLCISRQMYTAVQASNRKKHLPLNSYISLHATSHEDESGKEGEEFINFLGIDTQKDPEQLLIDKENVLLLERKIEENNLLQNKILIVKFSETV